MRAPVSPIGPRPDESTHWVLECPAERLQELATDPGFWCLMRLARHVNSMRFAQAALVHADDDDGPIGRRSRPGAFFYNGSILYEALQLLPTLRKHFASNPHWERSFGRFGTDEDIRGLTAQGTDLHRLRNHIGFHVLDTVPRQALSTLTLPKYYLARGLGDTVGAVYYELADTIALHYLLGSPASYEAFMQKFESRVAAITKQVVIFLEASDVFLPRAFQGYGLRPRIVSNDELTAD